MIKFGNKEYQKWLIQGNETFYHDELYHPDLCDMLIPGNIHGSQRINCDQVIKHHYQVKIIICPTLVYDEISAKLFPTASDVLGV